jgi:hypothetical protein
MTWYNIFQQPPPYQGLAYGALQSPNLIGLDDDESIMNVFCFGVFVDKNNGVVYSGLHPKQGYRTILVPS